VPNKRRSKWNFRITFTTPELQDKEEAQIAYEATGRIDYVAWKQRRIRLM